MIYQKFVSSCSQYLLLDLGTHNNPLNSKDIRLRKRVFHDKDKRFDLN